MTTDSIIELIQNDPWRMEALRAARSLELPDWLIGAGFVRNPVWDYLHGYTTPTPTTDIDVVYFDPGNLSEEVEKEYEAQLRTMMNADWSVTNQARMAKLNNQPAEYVSTEDALAHWPETATAIGVQLNPDDTLRLIAPHGISDLVTLQLRMTPGFTQGHRVILERVEKKQWLKKWPKLRVVDENEI